MQVLKGGAIGPDGVRVPAGEPPSEDWPQWFLDDLKEHGHLVAAPARRGQQPDGEPVTVRGTSSRGRKATR